MPTPTPYRSLAKDTTISTISNIDKNRMCWMRSIEVILTSRKIKKSMIFGTDDKYQFTMDITGTKNLALNKDSGTFRIHNLEYDKIAQIVLDEYYIIEIKAGYKSLGNLPTIFKGEVSYISQKIHSKHDTETYITFASTVVARYSQKRMNFNLNSGINLYAALNYVCKISGVGKNVKIDPRLQKEFLTNVYTNYNTVTSVFDNLTATSGNYFLSSDYSEGNVINCTTIDDKRKIKIDPNTINITRGNPTVTSAGLQITLLPTFNYMPGDIILVDNSLIDISVSNASAVPSTFNQNYLDTQGQYMIIEITYHFQNRGAAFEYNIRARALDIIRKIQMEKQ